MESYIYVIVSVFSNLHRSSSEPLGLDKLALISASSTCDGDGNGWRSSSHRKNLKLKLDIRDSRSTSPSCQLAEKATSPQKGVSPLVRVEDGGSIDKVGYRDIIN